MTETKKINHIAFIPSGNRRWASKNGITENIHKKGVGNFESISELCFKKGIKYVSFWTMSTENLKKREKSEIDALFKFVLNYNDSLKGIIKNEIRIFVFGDLSGVPFPIRQKCLEVMKKTEEFSKGNIILFFNYGGRNEIIRAVKKILKDNISVDNISEETFESYLDTAGIPDPDLIVRTGTKNQQRLSGFLPWQSIYSELFFTKTFWPDFGEIELNEAIDFFENTQRNFGK